MDDQQTGTILSLLGAGLILIRHWAAHGLTQFYERLGISVSEQTYAKQFVFVGILLIVLGLLMAYGLLGKVF